MKHILIVAMVMGMRVPLSAQTFSEWFSQKKTQIKYLHQQIAALAAFTADLQDGYQIIQKGAGVISDICQGDLDLHSNYFASLKAVSPSVASYGRIPEINGLAQRIVWNKEAVSGDVVEAAEAQLDLLQEVLTAGGLEMTDAERLQRIDAIYVSMVRLYRFSEGVRNAAAEAAQQQMQELSDVGALRIFYGIK